MVKTTINTAERIILELCMDIDKPSNNRMKWHHLKEEDLWVELVGCILGSQVSWEHATSALDHLYSCGLINNLSIVFDIVDLENTIQVELEKPIYKPLRSGGSICKYRFPRSKARQIFITASNIYKKFNSISKLLHNCECDYYARQMLIDVCLGIGPKQASLFLRNVGFTDRLAILDYHVLTFMKKKDLIPKETHPPTQCRQYLEIEKKFSQYANLVGVKSGILDRAIWTVMRMAEVS